ncbi:hypothetical protein IGI04_029957 [Brassica rapa subsp. trilocularis]|uniref:FACT complex subunit n=1 Tax=Brassica rapa subsp. trilocularis TaxID=1813537 RepID=A0ABQ7LT96_BRACM|nr:hypothetical protein IGI04_029957 [Brassica rapa subsp. trilocularis]
MDGFTKIVLKIPDDVPFDEAYYTHNLWIFFRKRVEKQKRTSSELSIMSKAMADQLGLKIEPSKDLFTFVDCSKIGWNTSLLFGRAYTANVGVVCNMQTNKLCLTLVDGSVFYNHVQVQGEHTSYIELGDDP